jgi:CheY-like chemotaxis protein
MVFRARGRPIHCRLISVSKGAIEATTELGFVERDVLGTTIDFEVRLDGADGVWLSGRGLVTNTHADTHRLVIATPDPIPELLVHIARSLVALRGSPEVMVVDRDRPRRARTAAAFRHEQCTVFEATTALEALDHLDRAEDPTLIEVAPTTPAGVGDELRDYLELAHPESRQVHVSGASSSAPATRRTRARERLALRARVRAVLDRFRK